MAGVRIVRPVYEPSCPSVPAQGISPRAAPRPLTSEARKGQPRDVHRLRIHLLGGFEVEEVDARRFGSRKARTLLKVLALARGAPVSTDRLADCLWPEDPPERPAEQVSVLVSRLRAVLGADRLSRSDAGYALHVDWLDLAELESRTQEAASLLDAGSVSSARAVATAALSLTRGELLAGETDAWWADPDRAATARLVSRARLVAAEGALRSGDGLAAVEHAGLALDQDPYDEAALRLVMRAHVAAGRPASALAVYARVRQRLAEDLGTSPAGETEALHTAILREEHVAAPVVAPPRRRLRGRDEELAVLDGALARAGAGSLTLAVVEGEAGIGKTSLVEAWADAARERGAVVLVGRCDPLGGGLPFQPLGDALDGHLRRLDGAGVASVLGETADVLAPVLGRRPTAEARLDALTDPARGLAVVFEALLEAIMRTGDGRPTALILEDMRHAERSTLEWLHFASRRRAGRPLLVVVTRRLGEGGPLPLPHIPIPLGPLTEEATAEIVGPERSAELHSRSGGHPLFLVELAAAPPGQLPASIREAVARRCEAAGREVATTLRTAALLGGAVDVDLLAGVLGVAPAILVDRLEAGVRLRLLEERPDGFAFRHELVREALTAGVSVTRAALVHREAAAALARRPDTDPLAVARHARLGGDAEREVAALMRAAGISLDCFDYATAETLLGQALGRQDTIEARLLRARVRLMLRQFDAAQEDATAALGKGAGAEAMEVAAWIAYYRRDQPAAVRLAADGARLAEGPSAQARCLTVLGRARHSLGEVEQAERDLRAAVGLARGRETLVPSVWLGALLTHAGGVEEAIELLRPATLVRTGEELSLAPLYAYTFRAYAHALQAHPLEALAGLDLAVQEIRRRQVVPRLYGMAENLRGWVLRNLGAFAEADDANLAALAAVPDEGEEPNVHAELDLAAGRLLAGDAEGARRRLRTVDGSVERCQTFVWRTKMRRLHLGGRLALLEGGWDEARMAATELSDQAANHRAAGTWCWPRSSPPRPPCEPATRSTGTHSMPTSPNSGRRRPWRHGG